MIFAVLILFLLITVSAPVWCYILLGVWGIICLSRLVVAFYKAYNEALNERKK